MLVVKLYTYCFYYAKTTLMGLTALLFAAAKCPTLLTLTKSVTVSPVNVTAALTGWVILATYFYR